MKTDARRNFLKELAAVLLIFFASCKTSAPLKSVELVKPKMISEIFGNTDGCFILYDLKADKLIDTFGEIRCSERLPATSTFKIPLALIAADAGIIKDQTTPFKWNGLKWKTDSWNSDQTAASWIQNSVVWVSQQITPMLGKGKLQKYLVKFNYGNKDLSAGITGAWLTSKEDDATEGVGSLKISAQEQLKFLTKLWKGELPTSTSSRELTKKLLTLETSPKGFVLHGKTGSGFLDPGPGTFGWFVGEIERSGEKYIFVTTFTRTEKSDLGDFSGREAKEMTKQILEVRGLW